MPGQQEDVAFAERRFEKPDGYGVMFTNGTGTGKTFLGLGVVKRFSRQGKNNILMVAPNEGVINQWIASAPKLGLTITRLESTTDAGKGIVVTTYANFGYNNALASRNWDLIIADEAHNLSSNKNGDTTHALEALRALTRHPRGASKLAEMRNPQVFEQLRTLAAFQRQKPREFTEAMSLEMEQLTNRANALMNSAREEFRATKPEDRPRTLFLSATPFAYEKNTQYAEGFLFEFPKNKNGEASYDDFMVQNFGYRIRYGKLTEPDAKVDRSLMQRGFNTRLKREGVLSNRLLEVPHDYDRRFVLVESAIGKRIDDALAWMRDDKFRAPMYDMIQGQFDYLSQQYLLEAIKAGEAIPYIKSHLAKGRKVVVFHNFKKGGGFHPFRFPDGGAGLKGKVAEIPTDQVDLGKLPPYVSVVEDRFVKGRKRVRVHLDLLYAEFQKQFPDLMAYRLQDMPSPIDALTKEFGDRAGVYNADIPKKQREATKAKFQRDNSKLDVIVVQADAGGAGLSLHDETGTHQRVLMNLGLPIKPTTAIQQEGRIYRVGQQSDAIIRYFNTGTTWERRAFASKIARRASEAENLGQGEEARNLLDGFINAFEESDAYPAGMEGEGKGSKAADREAMRQIEPFDHAITLYYAKQKRTQRTKAAEGIDYFATPEPLGFKMAEWADAQPGESMLEPSGGDGAIARWFRDDARRRAIEPSLELSSLLSLKFDGDVVTDTFENHDIVNKYDAIVMNPPFGHGGKTAFDHLTKAWGHLREGGRIVALVPRGGMAEKRLETFLYGTDKDGKMERPDAYLVADIDLPAATFERAGTAVRTHIMVIQRGEVASPTMRIDLSGIDDINQLFGALREMTVPPRKQAKVRGDRPDGGAFALGEFNHTRTGEKFYAATPNRLSEEQFAAARTIAKRHGGYYSSFAGGGALRGFLFKSAEEREAFTQEYGDANLSRGTTVGLGLGRAAVEAHMAPIVAGWKGAPKVNITAKPGDWPFPAPADAEGAFWNGELWLAGDNLATLQRAEEVLLGHEATHLGLSRLGPTVRAAILSAYETNDGVRQLANAWMRANQSTDKAKAAEEALAQLGEKGVLDRLPVWQRIVAAVRAALRALGFRVAMSDGDVQALLVAARRAAGAPSTITRAPSRPAAGLAPVAAGEPAAAATNTPEFKAWFGDSKVVDADGAPMVMYHGTTRGGFTEFDRLRSLQWRGPSMDTIGSWFSSSPSDSDGAGLYSAGGNSTIYPVYLSIKNPKKYRTFNDFLRHMHRAAGRPMPSAPGRGSTDELRAELIADGYDGIEFEQTDNTGLMRDIEDMLGAVKRAKDEEFSVRKAERAPYTQKRERLEQTLKSMRKELDEFGSSTEFDGQRVFIAFHPEQIKSAIGNSGAFDPRSPSILEQSKSEYARDNDNEASTIRVPEATGGATTGKPVPAAAADGNVGSATPLPFERTSVVASPVTRGAVRSGVDRVTHPAHAAHVFASMRKSPNELFDALVLDKEDKPIAYLRLFQGSLTTVNVYVDSLMRELFAVPGAASFWIAHNHPSGTAASSEGDRSMTRRVTESLRGLGIEPRGHIIVAGQRYVTLDPSGNESGSPTAILPAAREHRVPVMTRSLRFTDTVPARSISDWNADRLVTHFSGGEEGILFGDGQLRPVAFLPVSYTEIEGPLRNATGQKLARAISRYNPTVAWFHSAGDFQPTDEMFANLGRMMSHMGVELRDVIVGGEAWRAKGLDVGSPEVDSDGRPTGRLQPFYSRQPDAMARDLARRVRERIAGLTTTSRSFSRMKWVQTQFHKAEKDPHFAKVFRSFQRFLDDVSLFSLQAADLAPSLLPKMGSLADALRQFNAEFGTGAEFYKRMGAWARGTKTQQQKDMERAGQAVFAGTVEDETVYTDEQLRDRFSLTDKQIGYYREFRAAINASLENLGVSVMAQKAQFEDLPHIIAQVYGTSDLRLARNKFVRGAVAQIREAEAELSNQMQALELLGPNDLRREQFQEEVNRINRVIDSKKAFIKDIREIAERTFSLQNRGYAPLMRFGNYAVTVRDSETGEIVYFAIRDSESDARKLQAEMDRVFAEDDQAVISEVSPMSKDRWQMFRGLTPETLDVFMQVAGLDRDNPAYQQYLRYAISERSALKRMIQRKKTPGYVADDLPRVLAAFVTSTARQSSKNWHLGRMQRAVAEIPVNKGDVIDEAIALNNYVQNPMDEAERIRGYLFFHFIGGSLASAVVNLSQPVLMTLPHLSRWGVARATAAMTNAAAIAAGKAPSSDQLRRALQVAEEQGIVAPHELYQLYAESTSTIGGNRGLRAFMKTWGTPFALAETVNRRLTFIAAFTMAQQMRPEEFRTAGPDVRNAFEFAARAVEATQGIYNRGNRPNIARGPVGATVMTFRQFPIMYVEHVSRQIAWARKTGNWRPLMLQGAVLILAAGFSGLPFMEDLEDLIDTIGQALGYPTNTRVWRDQLLADVMGKEMAQLASYGTLSGTWIDVHGRLSFSNLIPGTGVLKRSETSKLAEIGEAIGPVGGLVRAGANTFENLVDGRFGRAALNMMPKAVGDFGKAVDMWSTGWYRDERGRNVVEVDPVEAFVKGIGFQPSDVAEQQRRNWAVQQTINFVKQKETSIVDKLARAQIDGDKEGWEGALEELRAWNADHPDLPIKVAPAQIKRRVHEWQLTKEERILKSAPRELRPTIQQQLQ